MLRLGEHGGRKKPLPLSAPDPVHKRLLYSGNSERLLAFRVGKASSPELPEQRENDCQRQMSASELLGHTPTETEDLLRRGTEFMQLSAHVHRRRQDR